MPINVPNIGADYIIDVGDSFDLMLTGKKSKKPQDLIVQRDGSLLLSGLLEDDERTMLGLECLQTLTHLETRQNGEWIAILFKK